ncbi:unnamed protein product [Brachionus calyciflorus]|uniref:G-protein coupled receptors family 1 profile domain-containing protein n=1 Tax=Brachionus calyciflorus TaxID=104777 RepID=A0A814K7K0_9BILA|nr:unnamed protein product [Brachionus calyciflorus]
MQIIFRLLSYLPIGLIIVALIGNISCLLIFRLNKNFRNISSMVYLSFTAVFDTLSLFEWNLNLFLRPNFNLKLEYLNLFNCKFIIFIQFFSLQSSAILLSLMCIDRFMTIISKPGSIFTRLPFSTNKSAYVWSILTLIFIFMLNSHILIFNGNFMQNSIENVTKDEILNGIIVNDTKIEIFIRRKEKCFWYSPNFKFITIWNRVNLIVRNFIPFTLMLVFNTLLITMTLMSNKKGFINKSTIRKRRLTISILSITFAFILMTMPSSILHAFFYEKFAKKYYGVILIRSLDFVSFSFNSTLFLNCFITNRKFRNYIRNIISNMFLKKF